MNSSITLNSTEHEASHEMDATENDSDVRQSYSVRKLRKSTSLHTWVIEDFSLCGTSNGFMESGIFTTDNGKTMWRLRLYLRGQVRYDEYVYLQLVMMGAGTVEAKGRLWVVTADKTDKTYAMDIRKFSSQDLFQVYLGQMKDLLDKSGSFVTGDVLTLNCEVTTVEDYGYSCACTPKEPLQGPSLADDFSAFLENFELSDMTLVAGGKTFHVHKAVLAARSPVFNAMFKHAMGEKLESHVQLNDLTAEVVTEMLNFIYTDTVPNLSSTAVGLLEAAEKYDIKRLKYMCEQELSSGLESDTVVDVLRLADRLGAIHLKRVAVYYINAHADDVRKSECWKTMVKEEPCLLECIYDGLLQTPIDRE
ncbi:speckle-type POZ protein-like [Ornithodoros turicata]|uniref:speckle-type POZ protein-like n=1 Tax=Ornithodoros turicata TaxID=34597 RepID=UPI0031386EF3